MASETSSRHSAGPFSLVSGQKKGPVTLPLVSSNKTNTAGRFLRRPLVPKVEPKLPPTPPPANSNATRSLNGEFLVEPHFYYEDGEYPPRPPDYSFERSGTSPPPPSEFQANSSSRKFKSDAGSTTIQRSTHTRHTSTHSMGRSGVNGRFVLDPIYREQTNIGTYVEGKALVQPFKSRGPDPLPARVPVRRQQPPLELNQDEDLEESRYEEAPEFTLNDFLQQVSEEERLPMIKVKQVAYSKNNYMKIQNLIFEHINPSSTTLTKVTMKPPEEMPNVAPRIPQKQLLIEMAALIKEQMSSMMGTNVRPMIKSLPKFSPDYKPGHPTPHTEIVLYEDSKSENANSRQLRRMQESEAPGRENLFSSRTRYFQDSQRTNSPFDATTYTSSTFSAAVLPDEDKISPGEMAVLDCLMNGATALSLKANFVGQLPDIELLANTLTYLNLSFNEFAFVPYEVFELEQLTTLKLRNNPIHEIPNEISALKSLEILVFSFCLVTSLPIGLFSLTKLKHLDFSYNKVSFVPNEIRRLKQLHELNMEGNQLPALPMGILRLPILRAVRVRCNYMHPLFWRENSMNSPPRLTDMAARMVHKVAQDHDYTGLPENIIKLLHSCQKCHCCRGPMYGPGLRLIRPVSEVFGIRHVPIIFRSCSPRCLEDFKNLTIEELVELLYGSSS